MAGQLGTAGQPGIWSHDAVFHDATVDPIKSCSHWSSRLLYIVQNRCAEAEAVGEAVVVVTTEPGSALSLLEQQSRQKLLQADSDYDRSRVSKRN